MVNMHTRQQPDIWKLLLALVSLLAPKSTFDNSAKKKPMASLLSLSHVVTLLCRGDAAINAGGHLVRRRRRSPLCSTSAAQFILQHPGLALQLTPMGDTSGVLNTMRKGVKWAFAVYVRMIAPRIIFAS